MRLSKRLARKRTGRVTLPPVDQLLHKARSLRLAHPDDAGVAALCIAFEETTRELLAAGYTLRPGGGEKTRPIPLQKELRPYEAQWEKPPPEK
jgi:hypothetical protein